MVVIIKVDIVGGGISGLSSALSSVRPEGNAYDEAENRTQKAIIDTREGIPISLKMVQSFLESPK